MAVTIQNSFTGVKEQHNVPSNSPRKTCLQFAREVGSAPRDAMDVCVMDHESQDISNQPIINYEGRLITVTMKAVGGG